MLIEETHFLKIRKQKNYQTPTEEVDATCRTPPCIRRVAQEGPIKYTVAPLAEGRIYTLR